MATQARCKSEQMHRNPEQVPTGWMSHTQVKGPVDEDHIVSIDGLFCGLLRYDAVLFQNWL